MGVAGAGAGTIFGGRKAFPPNGAPSAYDVNLWIKENTRNGLVLPNSLTPGTNDIAIKLPYLDKPVGTEYYKIADNGALDIGASDFTFFQKVYVNDKTAGYYLGGKNVAGSLIGRYGFSSIATSGYVTFLCQSSGGTYTITNSIDVSGGWHWLLADINQTTKKIRFFIDNVQVGTDTAFTGTFNNMASAYEFYIGSGNNSSGSSVTLTAKSKHADTGILNRLLTDQERSDLITGIIPSGCKAYYPMLGTDGKLEYDVSGNGYHLTGVNMTAAKYSYGNEGSAYGLNVGFAHYQNGFGDIYIGLKADGTAITPTGIDPGYKITAEGIHLGDALNYNLANARLVIPGWDRSNATIFNEAARRAYTYYNASAPTEWHPTELNNLLIQSWKNTGYKGVDFVKVEDHSYKKRKVMKEIFSFNTNKTSTDYLNIITNYCKDYVFNGIYENDHIYWKFDTNKIITVNGSKRIKWEDAATDKIWLSTDNGATYSISINSPKNGVIPRFGHIFQNGNILIAFSQNIYLSTDNLSTLNEITVKAIDGSDYVGGTNSFYKIIHNPPIFVNEKEMFIFGTYSTKTGVAHDNINVFYSVDNGATIKSCYKAGVTNPPLLGARHIHATNYRSYDDTYWVTTGDNESPYTGEANVIKGSYNWETDVWTWSKVAGDLDAGCTYKIVSIYFPDADTAICGDDNTTSSIRNGIWKTTISGFNNIGNAISIFKTPLGGGLYIYINGNDIFAAHPALPDAGVVITSKTGFDNLIGHKIHGLPEGIGGMYLIGTSIDGWMLIACGDVTTNEGEIIGQNVKMWVKIK